VDVIGGQAATREGAQALIDAGADGIVTDRADLAMAVLRDRTGTPDRL